MPKTSKTVPVPLGCVMDVALELVPLPQLIVTLASRKSLEDADGWALTNRGHLAAEGQALDRRRHRHCRGLRPRHGHGGGIAGGVRDAATHVLDGYLQRCSRGPFLRVRVRAENVERRSRATGLRDRRSVGTGAVAPIDRDVGQREVGERPNGLASVKLATSPLKGRPSTAVVTARAAAVRGASATVGV